MAKKILIGLGALLVAFLGYVSTLDGSFHYERSGVIEATPDVIFPYLVDLTRSPEWSPFIKNDPNIKITNHGEPGEVGSALEWEGQKSGTGRLEITGIEPGEKVDLRLMMLKPAKFLNLVEFRLAPAAPGGTEFTWSMSGDGGYIGKLMSVFIDGESMVAGQFAEGIENLKKLIESQNP